MQEITNNKSNFFERISQIIDYYDIKSVKSFACDYLGYDSSEKINRLKDQNKYPSYTILNDISNKFENVNAKWLLTGKGNMLKNDNSELIRMTMSTNLAETNHRYEEIDTIRIPIMDISAAAGLTGFMNDAHFDTLDHLSLPAQMVRSGTNVAVRVRGESMSPTLFDSDSLVIRLLDPCEWSEMTDEHVYVVVDKESKVYLKRVKNRFESGFIVCMSDNIDKFNYPNFNLQSNEIISIWHAEWRFSAKMPNINDTYFNRIRQLEDRFDALINTLNKPV